MRCPFSFRSASTFRPPSELVPAGLFDVLVASSPSDPAQPVRRKQVSQMQYPSRQKAVTSVFYPQTNDESATHRSAMTNPDVGQRYDGVQTLGGPSVLLHSVCGVDESTRFA